MAVLPVSGALPRKQAAHGPGSVLGLATLAVAAEVH